MSHTSAQSSHNPAPDLGPEPSTESIIAIQWMRKVNAKLMEIDERMKRLEGSDTMPMLLDLSQRLEALEEMQEKHNELLFSHDKDFKVLDTRTQQLKDSQQRAAEAITRLLL